MAAVETDTIAALATPLGYAGVGIVRVSGARVNEVMTRILKKTCVPRHATYLKFYKDDVLIDEGIALYFQAPHSFTGEDVLELQGHGGPVVLDHLLKTILSIDGIRLARPGEFTERAFLNDKLDLVQAEAISDLIYASSELAAQSALHSLQGDFSKKINALIEELIYVRMYVEAAIDFPEEEVDFLSDATLTHAAQQLLKTLNDILLSAQQGSLLREGLKVVLAGKPNAGKSSLLNALSGRDLAIVTAIPGTTRDVLKEMIHIDGLPLHIIDTAGLRDSNDVIEQEGIRRALAEIKSADVILFLVDVGDTQETDPAAVCPELKAMIAADKSITVIQTKLDLNPQATGALIQLSVKTGQGLTELKNYLKSCAGFHASTEGVFMARRRHLQALEMAKTCVEEGFFQLMTAKACELLAEELRRAQEALSSITGEFTSDDLLGKIFGEFCIGK